MICGVRPRLQAPDNRTDPARHSAEPRHPGTCADLVDVLEFQNRLDRGESSEKSVPEALESLVLAHPIGELVRVDDTGTSPIAVGANDARDLLEARRHGWRAGLFRRWSAGAPGRGTPYARPDSQSGAMPPGSSEGTPRSATPGCGVPVLARRRRAHAPISFP